MCSKTDLVLKNGFIIFTLTLVALIFSAEKDSNIKSGNTFHPIKAKKKWIKKGNQSVHPLLGKYHLMWKKRAIKLQATTRQGITVSTVKSRGGHLVDTYYIVSIGLGWDGLRWQSKNIVFTCKTKSLVPQHLANKTVRFKWKKRSKFK